MLGAFNGVKALQADADVCVQQENADAMVDFAKLPGVNNMQALISNAIAYRHYPRNVEVVDGVTPKTLFCNNSPRNFEELASVFNAQLPGTAAGLFGSPTTGLVAFGARE